MIIIATILSVLLLIFSIVIVYSFTVGVMFGAPYLPTLESQRKTALKLLDLKPGQTVYDLGCGDGRMLREAAKQGLNAVGYEMSPALVFIARIINFRYRKQVKIILGNYWPADWSKADGIFIFLLDKYMVRFDEKMKTLNKPMKVASYTFQIPHKKPVKKENAVFLYTYD